MCNDISSWEEPGVWNAGLHRELGWPRGRGSSPLGQGLLAPQGPRVPEPRAGSGRDDQVPMGQGSHDHFLLLSSLPRPSGKGQRLLDRECPLQPPHPGAAPPAGQHLTCSFPAAPSLWGPSVLPGVARPPFQSFLETLSPNRQPQPFGPLARRTQGPWGPSAALPRSSLHCPGPLAHVLSPSTLNQRPGSPLSPEIGFIFPAGARLLTRVIPRMKRAPRGLASLRLPASALSSAAFH